MMPPNAMKRLTASAFAILEKVIAAKHATQQKDNRNEKLPTYYCTTRQRMCNG